MKVLNTIEKKEKMLTKVLLGNGILLVTPASKTKKILEESKYEQIAKKNFCLWRSSLSHLKLKVVKILKEPTYEQIAMQIRTFACGGAACQA